MIWLPSSRFGMVAAAWSLAQERQPDGEGRSYRAAPRDDHGPQRELGRRPPRSGGAGQQPREDRHRRSRGRDAGDEQPAAVEPIGPTQHKSTG